MTTAYERLLEALLQHGCAVKDAGQNRSLVQCPAHDDGHPSLSVSGIEGQALVYCHAGCDTSSVLHALDLMMADLFDDRSGAQYTYPDGRTVHRTPDKKFRQSGNTKGSSLFRADRVADATTVYVVEGEKDVLAVESLGAVAVCSPMGAGKAKRFDWSPLRDKRVVVVADRDEPGRRHAADIVNRLADIAHTVEVAEPATGKDIADHIAAGKSLTELVMQNASLADAMPRLWNANGLRPAAQPVWLAKNRILKSAINLLIGDEGIGKSLLWVWVVAAVTTGKELLDFGIPKRAPGHVILACTEDDWTTIVRPRLEVAGADLSMIQVICVDEDGSGAPLFPRDLHLIATADPPPVMVVVDAWLDTVPAALSVRDPQQARQALHPWRELATATEAAVLLLCHTNRVSSSNARDRYGATGELRKKARMTLYAQADEDGRLVVGPEKMNTAAPIPASTFIIEPVNYFDPTPDNDGTVPRLVFAGHSEHTAREHLVANVESGGEEPGGNPAKAFVYEYLLRNGGEAAAADVMKAGRAATFSEQELKDARRRHRKPRIESRKASFGDGWVWAICVDQDGTPPQGGTQYDQGGVDGTEDDMPPVPPPSPPSPPSQGPPGAPTDRTPGMTDRVRLALATAQQRTQCPRCQRAPARTDSQLCDFCTAKARREAVNTQLANLTSNGEPA